MLTELSCREVIWIIWAQSSSYIVSGFGELNFPNAAARTSSSRDGAQREDRSERFANLIVSIYPICFWWKNSCVSLLALYPIRRVLCDSLLDK